ncbi:centrosomal protein of 290 kDa isoform X2 [Halyomorpha halys]|uniref:centrosomal protein of 290 kDa isoform X2 n=1 Tax=Halyomorpha halys TaxID=286706 RepID=UPI0006D4F2B1
MVQANIDSILAVNPEKLSSQEKDDLYESIMWLNVEPNTPHDKFEPLFVLTKEVLKYKGEQVESLLADLDILASSPGGNNEELHAELSKANKQIEKLNEEIENKEKELENERLHIEKLQSDIVELQREKADLRKEIIIMQSEGQNGMASSIQDESSDDTAQLKEMIQHKNKHILQLLSDIQVLEKDNEIVNTKLNSIRQELSDATTNLTKFSGENISLRQANYEFQEKLATLEERNIGLTSQVAELVEERNKRESHLDILIDALEERVAKWQEILSQKDEEVTELRAKLNETVESPGPKGSMAFAANYTELSKTIEEQEDIIKKLHEQLKQATEDMTKSSVQVQELKQRAEEKSGSDDDSMKYEELKEELEKAHNQIHFLQEKVNDAEQDAQFRAEEMTELIIQLREYEEGVYGLAEARNQVKDLKKQLKIRDSQILKLVEQINTLSLQSGEEAPIDTQNYEKYFEDEDKNSNIDLQTQLSAVQQTAINLSVQNFELRAKVAKLSEDLKTKEEVKNKEQDLSDKKELEDKLRLAIEENESLRKGLHEILESIQKQDESLLDALDARHVSGWYHPAMRLQAVINKLQGNNDALRLELRESRFRESYFQAELQTSMLQLGELQDKLKLSEAPITPVPAPRTQIDKSKDTDGTKEKTEGTGISNDEKVIPVSEKPPSPGDTTQSLKSAVDTIDDVNLSSSHDLKISQFVEKVVQTECLGIVESAVQTEPIASDLALEHNGVQEPVKEMLNQNKDVQRTPENLEVSITNDQAKNGMKVGDLIDKFNNKELPLASVEENKKVPLVISTDQKMSIDAKPSNGEISQKMKLEEMEKDLKKKCEELRLEFENIKKMNENALLELHKNKEVLFSEVKAAMIKVNEEVKSLKQVAEKPQPVINEFTLGAFKEQETKLLSYGIELGDLRRALSEKDSYITSLESKVKSLNLKLEEAGVQRREVDDLRAKALKETISSLQQIINKKEVTIERYKVMLEESNTDYGQLLEKFHSLERSKEKISTPREPLAESKSVSILMEKWIERVHALETEINNLTHRLIEATNHLEASKRETQYWKNLVTSTEEKTTKDEDILKKQEELEELRTSLKELKEETEIGFQEKLKKENSKFRKKEEELNNLIKTLENENSRLKHQLNIRSAKTSTRSSKKETVLLEKIKTLEDELEKAKSREKSQLQLRRDKCADEVAKWEEKKKLQSLNEKYKQELKDKGSQMELFEGQISRLKVIIARMERERISLQRRLKTNEDLLSKYMSAEEKVHEFDDKSFVTDSRAETPPIPEHSPRSHIGSLNSELHDPKIKMQSRRDLVRAVTALKKVISKLRSEHSNYYHKDYVERLQNELQKMENNYMDAVERALSLEEQLRESEAKHLGETFIVGGPGDRTEIIFLKEQLAQKCELLSKVKILLQRAILREKQLIQQVTFLEKLVPPEKLVHFHEEAREI